MFTVTQGVGAVLICLGTLFFIIGVSIQGLDRNAAEEKDWWEI